MIEKEMSEIKIPIKQHFLLELDTKKITILEDYE